MNKGYPFIKKQKHNYNTNNPIYSKFQRFSKFTKVNEKHKLPSLCVYKKKKRKSKYDKKRYISKKHPDNSLYYATRIILALDLNYKKFISNIPYYSNLSKFPRTLFYKIKNNSYFNPIPLPYFKLLSLALNVPYYDLIKGVELSKSNTYKALPLKYTRPSYY